MKLEKLLIILPALLIMITLTCDSVDAKRKETIAVMDFDAIGTEVQEAQIVSNHLRVELADSKKFAVLDRKNIEKILKEQEMSVSDISEPSSAVKIGNLFNAQKIVVGSLSIIDKEYFLLTNMVDTSTGEIVKSAKINASGLRKIVAKIPKLVKEIQKSDSGKQISNIDVQEDFEDIDDEEIVKEKKIIENITPPEFKRKILPKYPKLYKHLKIQGVVTFHAILTTEGKIVAPMILTSLHPNFDKIALKALKRWKLTPAMYEGEPVNCYTIITFGFAWKADRAIAHLAVNIPDKAVE